MNLEFINIVEQKEKHTNWKHLSTREIDIYVNKLDCVSDPTVFSKLIYKYHNTKTAINQLAQFYIPIVDDRLAVYFKTIKYADQIEASENVTYYETLLAPELNGILAENSFEVIRKERESGIKKRIVSKGSMTNIYSFFLNTSGEIPGTHKNLSIIVEDYNTLKKIKQICSTIIDKLYPIDIITNLDPTFDTLLFLNPIIQDIYDYNFIGKKSDTNLNRARHIFISWDKGKLFFLLQSGQDYNWTHKIMSLNKTLRNLDIDKQTAIVLTENTLNNWYILKTFGQAFLDNHISTNKLLTTEEQTQIENYKEKLNLYVKMYREGKCPHFKLRNGYERSGVTLQKRYSSFKKNVEIWQRNRRNYIHRRSSSNMSKL